MLQGYQRRNGESTATLELKSGKTDIKKKNENTALGFIKAGNWQKKHGDGGN